MLGRTCRLGTYTFHYPETACGFVSVAIRVTGYDLALFSLYLECGSSFDGRANALVLSNLYAVIATLKCPWCVAGDWNLDAGEVLATRLEDLTKGRLLGTAGTAAELDYALVHPRLASHLSLELAWDVPFKPHAALLCALPLKPLQDLQPILRTITDSFDPILESQRSLEPQVISPQRVTLLEIEACDPLSLAFAQFSATADTSGVLGVLAGRGVSLPTIRQPAVSQAPDAYQWFGHSHSVWSQLASRLQVGGPEREILYLLSKLGSDHRQWVETARAAVLSARGTETLTSYAAEQRPAGSRCQPHCHAARTASPALASWCWGRLVHLLLSSCFRTQRPAQIRTFRSRSPSAS